MSGPLAALVAAVVIGAVFAIGWAILASLTHFDG